MQVKRDLSEVCCVPGESPSAICIDPCRVTVCFSGREEIIESADFNFTGNERILGMLTVRPKGHIGNCHCIVDDSVKSTVSQRIGIFFCRVRRLCGIPGIPAGCAVHRVFGAAARKQQQSGYHRRYNFSFHINSCPV